MLAGLGISIWSGYDAKREAYSQEKQRANAEQHQTARNIASECAVSGAPIDIVAECLAAEMGAYEDSRNTDQDLQAQQDMAYWALWMFVVSAGGFFVSIGGLMLLLRSLRQTERAISTDREVGHAQVRAYLTIEPKEPSNLEEGKKAAASLHIRNAGQSPAYNVRYVAGVLIETHPLPPDSGPLIYPDPSQPLRIGSTVAAQGEFFAEGFSQRPLERDDLRTAMRGGDKRFYLSCIVYYKDVFGVERETVMTAFLDQVGETITDLETGHIGRQYGWMIAHTHNHAT